MVKFFYSILIFSVFSPLLYSCTPEQINSAIDECRGDPSCTLVIDSAIDQELEERGITGGRMTIEEMNTVVSFLESYIPSEFPKNISNTTIAALFFYSNLIGDQLYSFDGKNYYPFQIYEYIQNFNTTENVLVRSFYVKYFNLNSLNPNANQLVYLTDSTLNRNVKLVIYKTGNKTYRYEIWENSIVIIDIDLLLNNLYVNNTLVNSLDPIPEEVTTSFMEDFYNLSSIEFNDSNSEYHYFSNLNEGRFVYFNQQEDISYNAYRVYMFDFNLNKFYHWEIFSNYHENDKKTYITLVEYFNTSELGNGNAREVFLGTSKLSLEFNFSELLEVISSLDFFEEILVGSISAINSLKLDETFFINKIVELKYEW